MPKRSANDYEVDDGVMVHKGKGAGGAKRLKSNSPEESSENDGHDSKSGKNSKAKKSNTESTAKYDEGALGGMMKDKDGCEYWEISGKRRLQVSKFAGNTMINLREYYEDKKSGETLPGKKGIALTVEQFDNVISLLPYLESVLQGKGIKIKRPDFSGSEAVKDNDENEAEDAEGQKVESSKKKNYEETSEED